MKQVFTTNPAFEDLLRNWLNEWNNWCDEMAERYGNAPPISIEQQQKNFRVWIARQKNIIVFDTSEIK